MAGVARVIWHGINHGIPGDYLPFEKLPDPQRAMLLETARNVVATMREPTDAMVRNGDSSMVWQLFVAGIDVRPFANRDNEITRPVFREMIDEAMRS